MNDDQLFLAWAAGFFDGEGSVLVNPRLNGSAHSLFVSVTQQHPFALHMLKNRFGGNVTPDKTATSDSYERKKGATLIWRWKASSTEAFKFLELVQPYVVVKADQVRVALEFPEVGVRFCRQNPVPEYIKRKREQVMLALRDIRQASKVYLQAANG